MINLSASSYVDYSFKRLPNYRLLLKKQNILPTPKMKFSKLNFAKNSYQLSDLVHYPL